MIHNCVKRRKPLIHYPIGSAELVEICGHRVLMDAEDLHHLDGWTLSVSHGYVHLTGTEAERPIFRTQLTRLIMNAPEGMDVDHISGDRSDNRKVNLRICTRSENLQNMKKRPSTLGPFKGISYAPTYAGKKKWSAEIRRGTVRCFIGRFMTSEAAARAYNEKAVELFGEFARINVITSPGDTVSAKGVLNAAKP